MSHFCAPMGHIFMDQLLAHWQIVACPKLVCSYSIWFSLQKLLWTQSQQGSKIFFIRLQLARKNSFSPGFRCILSSFLEISCCCCKELLSGMMGFVSGIKTNPQKMASTATAGYYFCFYKSNPVKSLDWRFGSRAKLCNKTYLWSRSSSPLVLNLYCVIHTCTYVIVLYKLLYILYVSTVHGLIK